MLGNIDFHQGLGPHTHRGGARCMEHHFHEWPWEGQVNPQHVGKGPDLMSWQGASLWVPGRYLLDGTYHWCDRYCMWIRDLLCGSQAQVTSDDPIVGAHAVSRRAVVIGPSSEKPSRCGQVRLFSDGPLRSRGTEVPCWDEKPSRYGCGPRQARLLCDGLLYSRDTEFRYWERHTGNNVIRNQYLRVLTAMS